MHTFIGAPEVEELIQLRDERQQLIKLVEELKTSRLEDHAMIFHAGCGGIVTGELGKPLTCAECGGEMTAFVSAEEEAKDTMM